MSRMIPLISENFIWRPSNHVEAISMSSSERSPRSSLFFCGMKANIDEMIQVQNDDLASWRSLESGLSAAENGISLLETDVETGSDCRRMTIDSFPRVGNPL